MPRARTKLLAAVLKCSVDGVLQVLESGACVDEADEDGYTPLMVAATCGLFSVANVLLRKGASVSAVDDLGLSALHHAAREGFLAVTKLLVKSGANLEQRDSRGGTPLNAATELGRSEVVGALIEEGANPNSRALDGSTPLFIAANLGHLSALKVLLRAGANAQLVNKDLEGKPVGALDVAAHRGHVEVVRELIRQRGIEGCGGISRGIIALEHAAQRDFLETLAVLLGAGVVDSGAALASAAGRGKEASVKYLLRQKKGGASCRRAYVNFQDPQGETPLTGCIGVGFPASCTSPRTVRLLIDAGADARSKVRVLDMEDRVVFHGTPLALATRNLREKKVAGKDATEEQLHGLEGIRRLLLRVEAVHAASWLWPSDAPLMHHVAEVTGRAAATPTAVRAMLPTLRRRTRRPLVLLAPLFRCSSKP